MSTQRYSVTFHPIETIRIWVKSDEFTVPEIQRSIYWEATNERNLLLSLYFGFTLGCMVAWRDQTAKFKKCSELLQGAN